MFARYGVREYWIVDPAAETIEILELGPAGYELKLTATGQDVVAAAVLPGQTFVAESLFPRR